MMVICCLTVPTVGSEKTAIPEGVFISVMYFVYIVVFLPCMMVCSQYIPFLLG